MDIIIHYHPCKNNVSADSRTMLVLIVSSCYPVGQPPMYDACAEISLVAAIISQEGIDKEGGE